MKVLFWNVYINSNPSMIRAQVRRMAREHNPEIIGLAEASKMRGITDDIPGYKRIHLKPRRNRRGRFIPGSENANIAYLIREDINVRKRGIWRMKLRWKLRRRKVVHEPRVYIWTRFIADGLSWRIAVGHWPFGAAKRESKRKVKRWMMTAPGTRTAFVGDLNTRPAELTRYFKSYKHAGIGIDRAIYKNCTVRVRNLGKNGSDHPAVLFTFSPIIKKRRLTRRKK